MSEVEQVLGEAPVVSAAVLEGHGRRQGQRIRSRMPGPALLHGGDLGD
jgi:hypothetical protein